MKPKLNTWLNEKENETKKKSPPHQQTDRVKRKGVGHSLFLRDAHALLRSRQH